MKETPKKKKGGAGAAPLNDAISPTACQKMNRLSGKEDQKPRPLLLVRCTFGMLWHICWAWPLLRTGYLVMSDAPISEWSALLAWQVLASLFIVGVLLGLSLVYGKSTIYTLTNRRVILRTGAAVQIHVNFPLEQIASADLQVFSDGTGDIALKLENSDRLYWLLLWPNVRSWWVRPLQPLLRGLRDFELAASALASAASAESAVSLGEVKCDYEDVSVAATALPQAQ